MNANQVVKRFLTISPVVIARSDHIISRSNISENALKVLRRLQKAGYQAHLVGGGVRDLLLGREPKDFDVATDASPEEVRDTFRNCRLIGRRFRLAHVHFGRDIIEVATFRGSHNGEDSIAAQSDQGMILRDNVFGTIEEDALRRDFTVNALYYNLKDFSVIDYVGGVEDLQAGLLRLIGDPETRFREDPVRLLRAIRFAAKLGFNIHKDSEAPIFQLGDLLDEVPAARLFEEVLKLFLGGVAVHTFEKLRHYDLFRHLFPSTDKSLEIEEQQFPIQFVLQGLKNTDTRIREDKPVTPAFLFAVLLWEPVRQRAQQAMERGVIPQQAMFDAADEVISEQVQKIAIPRRFSSQMKEIWSMQSRLEKSRSGKRARRLLENPRFRAAYDFLLLRAAASEADQQLADWWTRYQENQPQAQSTGKSSPPRKRRPRSRRRKPAAAGGQ
ncbi:MAG: polynucleotide adenylyltransferase PcnB [Chromatiales bacterium]